MFIIGIDPHKGSHTAAVIDRDEQLVGELSVQRRSSTTRPVVALGGTVRTAGVGGRRRDRSSARCWRSSSSASGETVVDVPAALSARARLLDSGRKDKTDAHDARSAAIVALRHRNLRAVALEDHRQVLRLLARRHHQLIAARTRAICRLHAVLCEMIEGGLSKNLSAKRASAELRKLRPARRDRDRTQTDRRRVPRRGPPHRPRARRAPRTHRRRREGRRTRRSPTCSVSVRSSRAT